MTSEGSHLKEKKGSEELLNKSKDHINAKCSDAANSTDHKDLCNNT